MLARTYKTAEELAVSQDFLDALAWVQEMLETGKFRKYDGAFFDEKEEGPFNYFTMASFHMVADCGTGGCIGGWVANRMGITDPKFIPFADAAGVYELYYGICKTGHRPLAHITQKQAAQAIQNYRETGAPLWDIVLTN